MDGLEKLRAEVSRLNTLVEAKQRRVEQLQERLTALEAIQGQRDLRWAKYEDMWQLAEQLVLGHASGEGWGKLVELVRKMRDVMGIPNTI